MVYVFVPMLLLLVLLAATQEQFLRYFICSALIISAGLVGSSHYLDIVDAHEWPQAARHGRYLVFGIIAVMGIVIFRHKYLVSLLLISTYVLWAALEISSLVYLGRRARISDYLTQGTAWFFVALWVALFLALLLRRRHINASEPHKGSAQATEQ